MTKEELEEKIKKMVATRDNLQKTTDLNYLKEFLFSRECHYGFAHAILLNPLSIKLEKDFNKYLLLSPKRFYGEKAELRKSYIDQRTWLKDQWNWLKKFSKTHWSVKKAFLN